MRIGIVSGVNRDKLLTDASALVVKLQSVAAVYADTTLSDILPCDGFYEGDALFENCDIILTLGGDGTLLSVAEKAAMYRKPILGVNMGRLGFLTGCERAEFFASGYKKITGGYRVEKRMMISADVSGKDFCALNDVVLTRTSFARVGSISIEVNGERLGDYRADGVIVSTPTGSTAYSLSAGGPIVDPEMDALVITPICPHMLHARPVVVSSSKTLRLTVTDDTECALTTDGKSGCMIKKDEPVIIKKSPLYTQLIKINNGGFFDIVRNKLH